MESGKDFRDSDATGMNTKDIRTSDSADGGLLRQVLTFSLGKERYGVDILRVKEIRGWSPVTRLPQAPDCILGVLNLRGAIVPVMDLRTRFELDRAEFTPLTVVIVLSLHGPRGACELGVVVDSVNDVVDVASDNIRPALGTGSTAHKLIHGIAMCEEQMLILIDADALISEEPSVRDADEAAA
jgi:purine-binding chemotaxis protein CheW